MSSPSTTNFNKVKTTWLLSSLLIYLFIILSNGVAAQNDISVTNVGAILDMNSHIGQEQKIAMEIAAAKFNKSDYHKLILHFRDSNGNPFLAASAAEELMKEQKVQVIVGMEYWPEAVQVADQVRNQSQVPVISFGAPLITPPQIQRRWPFLIRMTSDGSAQMKCIADIVAAYSWKRVVVIYEDDGYGGYVGLVALLSEALQDANAKIEHHLVLPRVELPSESQPNWDELEELLKLPTFQSRVFIILQSSLPTMNNLFRVAKKMGLVGRESAWIFTECITSLLDPQGNPDMEGALGVKTYYPTESSSYAEFEKEFQAKYAEGNKYSKPGIYTLRAYDTLSVISQAIERMPSNTTSLLDMITRLLRNYKGLSGTMRLKEGEALLDSQHSLRFRIVNIVDGKMNTELNFWRPKFGFSEGPDDTTRVYVAGNVTWPGKLRRTPKGWTMPSSENPMIIGVPGETSFSEFVKVEYNKENPDENTYDGFCIQIFYKVLSRLNYSLPYEFHAHNGTYDELVEKVHDKTYDAVVGDMTVLSDRMDKVEFTQPYMGSGLSMIVPEVPDKEETWMFMKPFTWQMWVVTGSVLIYTMLIVWFLEHQTNPDFKGPWKDQLSTAVWFTFSSLFFAHREKVYSNLTRVVFIVWLFVVLILTSSYTANLSSMLTIQRLQPNVTDIQMLLNTNATVGLDGDSFMYKYMKDVVKFLPDNMMNISSEYCYTDMFKNKQISAAFLEAPYAEVFMNKYCEGYTSTAPTNRSGGLSFMFQKGSPFARDFTRAILELLESGEIKKLQNEWLTPQEECTKNSTSNQPESLSLNSFSGLYVISGVTSTFCLILSLSIWMRRFQQQGNASPSNENIWNRTVKIVKLFKLRDLEVPSRAPTFASYIVDWTTPRWREYSPTSNTPEQPPVFIPAEIECVPVEQAETRV